MSEWHQFLDSLHDDGQLLVKSELKEFVSTAVGDASEEVNEMASTMESYLTQLSKGEITKEQFASYMKDHARLARMRSRKASVESKARLQMLADGIQNLILDRMLKLI